MVDVAQLAIEIQAMSVKDATKALEDLARQGQQTEQQVSGSARVMGEAWSALRPLVAPVLAAFSFKAVLEEVAAAEKANAQLEAVLRSTGGAAGITADQVRAMAAEIQRSTTVSDEGVIALSTTLLQFDRITGPTFERAARLATDLSVRMGTDLKTAAVQVGKALQDPADGLATLARSGVVFSDSQKQVIDSLVAANRLGEAQTVVLDALETKFGGAGAAARDTLGGALAGLRNSFSDLLEGPGSAPALTDAINDLDETLNDPSMKEGFTTVVAGMTDMLGVAVKLIAVLGGVGTALGEMAARAQGFGGGLEEQLKGLEQTRDAIETGFPGGPMPGSPDEARYHQVLEEIANLKRLLGYSQGAIEGRAGGPPSRPAAGTGTTGGGGAGGGAVASPEALEQIRQMAERVEEATIREREGEEAALRYAMAHGELAAVIKQAGPDAQQYIDALLAGAAANDQAAAAAEARKTEEKAATEATRQAAEAQREFEAAQREATELVLSLLPEMEREYAIFSERVAKSGLDPETQKKLLDHWVADWQKAHDTMSAYAEQAARNVQDAFAAFLYDPFKNGLKGMLQAFADTLRQMIAQAASAKILEALFPESSGGLGGALSGIFSAVLGGGGGGAYASGGYTGDAPTDQVTGKVHGQEYVMPADAVRRIGLGNLEAMRAGAGMAGGGGGQTFQVNIDARGATDPAAIYQAAARAFEEFERRFVQRQGRGQAVPVY